MFSRTKIAGILVETGRNEGAAWGIIGIGININQHKFEGTYRIAPTSLSFETDRKYNCEDILHKISELLGKWFTVWSENGNVPIISAWKERSDMIGKTVLLELRGTTFKGIADDLNPDGTLVLRDRVGRKRIVTAGDVHLR